MRFSKEQLLDILERAFFTYVQSFLGLWMASGVGVDMGGLSTLKQLPSVAYPQHCLSLREQSQPGDQSETSPLRFSSSNPKFQTMPKNNSTTRQGTRYER